MSDDLIQCHCPLCEAERSRLASSVAAVDAVLVRQLAAQVAELERWKAEAILVIVDWEKVWEALRRPGELGKSKAEAALATVNRMTERGDALADMVSSHALRDRPKLDAAVTDWWNR